MLNIDGNWEPNEIENSKTVIFIEIKSTVVKKPNVCEHTEYPKIATVSNFKTGYIVSASSRCVPERPVKNGLGW